MKKRRTGANQKRLDGLRRLRRFLERSTKDGEFTIAISLAAKVSGLSEKQVSKIFKRMRDNREILMVQSANPAAKRATRYRWNTKAEALAAEKQQPAGKVQRPTGYGTEYGSGSTTNTEVFCITCDNSEPLDLSGAPGHYECGECLANYPAEKNPTTKPHVVHVSLTSEQIVVLRAYHRENPLE